MGMQVSSGDGSGIVADINVTPLVDVMLVMLIIFMVIAPMLQTGVSVALPKSKFPDPDPNIIKETSVVVSVPSEGEFYLGRDRVTMEDLPNRIKTMMKDKPPQEQIVYLKSATRVSYGTVVNVIDTIREAGFDRIGLVSEKEKGAPGEEAPAGQ